MRRPVPGDRVCLRFSLFLQDGTEVDATGDGEPWCFVVGDASLAPALEGAVAELTVGEKRIFAFGPDAIYGTRDESLIHPVARSDFPAGIEPAAGVVVAFATPSGEELPGTIVEVGSDEVLVDFNHPLADRALIFEAELVSIAEADPHE